MPENGNSRFFKHPVKSAVLLTAICGTAVLTAGLGIHALVKGVKPAQIPLYYADQVGITENNKEAKAEIGGYAAYESVSDQKWKSGELEQKITLVLPGTVTVQKKSASGEQKTVTRKNPVTASPHIFADFNHDGKFSEEECVYNPLKTDADGRVIDYGAMLRPGNQITKIRLTRKIPKGRYDGQVLWTGVVTESGTAANAVTFRFGITSV